ncbi:MAG: hypothetical protein HN855_07805 [Anaerolineae bacterium]|nr:hypothetical protein [Anaerolineae bacterium]MBT7071757.1 hypothetical protein [Anaerolineae bacterium]MBT7325045.1 hypothetical protein [Anaerolineae bacterium]
MLKQFFLLLSLAFLLACAAPPALVPAETPILPAATVTETLTPTFVPTFTPTPTLTPTATLTPTPTITPTYAILRAEVLERANCRYGPGAPYLYKYGLVKGSNLEVIGRLDDASWLQLQAIGGNNPCWVKASLMNAKGDVSSVEPVYPDKAPLPVSPYYVPLELIEVTREEDQVTIRWYGQSLRAGDEEYINAPLYLAEIWACEGNEIKFTPYGLWTEMITIKDEAGCAEASRGRVYFSEKHGYAGPTEIEFPQ